MNKKLSKIDETEYKLFRFVMDNSPDIIYIYDIIEKKNVYSNKGISKVLGFTAKEVKEMGEQLISILMHPDDFEKYLKTILPQYRKAKDNEWIEHDYRMKHKSGEWRWLYSKETVFNRTQDGAPSQIMGVLSDITAEKNTKSELQDALKKAEDNEHRFNELFSSMKNGCAIYKAVDNGADFVFLDFNKAAESIEKLTKAAVLGSRVTEVFPGIIEFGLFDVLKRVYATGKAEHFPLAFYSDDKIKGWRDNYIYKLNNGDIVAIYYDRTKEKQAEIDLIKAKEKAEENELQLNAILEKSPTGFAINKISTGEVTYVNKAFADAYHIPIVLCSKVSTFFEYVYSDQIELGNKIIEDLKSGIPERMSWDKIPIMDKETKSTHYVSASNIILEELDLVISTVLDMTSSVKNEIKITARSKEYEELNQKLIQINKELILAKEKAEESELQLKLIADNFVNGMLYQVAFSDETKRKFTYISEAVNKLYGCTPEQAMQNPDLIYGKLHPDDIGDLIEKEKEALKNMAVFVAESRVISPDGTFRWAYYISKPRIINGLVCWDGIEIDITERKQMEFDLLNAKEKAEESNRLKTEFISNMSHEIRTPMNGILGFSNLLNEPDLPESKRKYYTAIINNSGNQLMRIIDDIIEISKLGTKQVKTIEKTICLNDSLLELFSVFDIKAKENKTPLYLKKGLSDIDSTILTDDAKLNKIISNLLENALKFTNEGYIELGYNLVKTYGHASQHLEIYVKDTGIGVATDKQEVIFERFSQADIDLSKNIGGLGLGLSIAKENAELLGGTITLQSEIGKGSTFFVTIPYKAVKTDDVSADIENTRNNPDKRKILIVEDEEVNSLYLETLIEIELLNNFHILHAKNGKEAIEICEKESEICLVFMDLKMPVMNGFDATKEIKKRKPHLTIVAQTAYTTSEDEEKARAVGCNDFITKPIDKEKLIKILNTYL